MLLKVKDYHPTRKQPPIEMVDTTNIHSKENVDQGMGRFMGRMKAFAVTA